MGLLLRYQLLWPVEGLNYTYVLHGHSHVMFLGWVFNVLLLAFIQEFTAVNRYKILFWLLQVCVLGMLIFFPLQGYDVGSIVFSALHTAGAIVFILMFFRATKQQRSLAIMLAKAALLFFILSAIGPFGLAYCKANGLQHTDWYRFSIYFYLHFQYNGFFFFGILSLFLRLIEHALPEKSLQRIRYACYVLVIACVPAYALSLLWAEPHGVFHVIGLIAALAQLVAAGMMVNPVRKTLLMNNGLLQPQVKLLFLLSFVALIVKLVLQVISAHPAAALFAEEFRSVVIAYLHLVLVGVVTVFLIGWLVQKRILANKVWPVILLLTGFTGSEILLVLLPWWSDFAAGISFSVFNYALFMFSCLMVCATGLMLRAGVVAPK